MASYPPQFVEMVRDARWLAHRYDPGHDAFHLRWTPRDAHRAATFITDDYLGAPDRKVEIVRRTEAMAVAAPAAPIHFVFHSAYCCSTLLARAMDAPGTAMGLKEPVILNDLVGWRRQGAPPAAVAGVLDQAMTLLARPFAPGEAVVVKPSNVVNGLARVMLALRPDARAVLLHAPLETYVRSIAKKDMDGRLWVRTLFVGLLRDGLVDLGFDDADYLGLTDLQVAAVGWLAQQALFDRLVREFGADRIATCDSETLVAHPTDALRRVARLFDLPLDADTIARGPAFTRHSKSGDSFAGTDRAAEHREAAERHATEIARVVAWAAVVADRAGVPMTLDAPLVGR